METRRPGQAERLLQAARIVGDRNVHRSLRHVDIDAPARRAAETHRAGQGEDPAGADGEHGRWIDGAGLVEADREVLDTGRGGEPDPHPGLLAGLVDDAVAVVVLAVLGQRHGGRRVVGQQDGLVERHTRGVQAYRHGAADGQAVEADEARLAVGVHRIARDAGRRRRPLHQADRGVADQQADRIRVEHAVGVAQLAALGHRTEEDLDLARAVERHVAVGLDREVALEFEERVDRDSGVEDREAHHPALGGAELDGDHGGAHRDGLVHRAPGGVDLQQHVATQGRDAGDAGLDGHAQRAGDAVRGEDEAALPFGQLHAQHVDADLGCGDAHRARRRNRVLRVGVDQGDLLDGEIAVQAERRGHRRVGAAEGDAEIEQAGQAQVGPLRHRQRGFDAVDEEGLVDRDGHGADLDRQVAGDRDGGAAAVAGGGKARQVDARRHALLGDDEVAVDPRGAAADAQHRVGRVA